MNSIQLTATETTEAINKLEQVMLQHEECTTEFDKYLEHYFADGIYVREMKIPRDTIIIGKTHLMNEVCILTKGSLIIVVEGSAGSQVYQAPMTFTTTPGKKAAYVLEDSIVINVHPNPTNTRDLDKLRKELIAPDQPVLEVV